MFFQEAACDADDWTDVHIIYDDRRSFDTFLDLLETSGLDKYASNEDNDINVSNQPNRWLSLEVSPVHLCPDISANSNWDMATKYYSRSLSLMRLFQRIRSESGNDFRREQAGLLESFLYQLIKIQQEQRFVAYSFSGHLEQLRMFDAVAFSSNGVYYPGDRFMCHLIVAEHNTVFSYTWKQKHLFDSLYIISRESAWLLKQLQDSCFTSPSSIKESNKILDIILDFISEFKKSKESLDQCLLIHGRFNVHPVQLVALNNEILDDFGGRIKNLEEQGVERKSVAGMLLGCYVDVVNMYYNRAERGNPFGDTCSSLQCSFSEAAKETSELINEAVDKLISVRCSDLTGGGSPLGCIALWRILFESSLINLQLDLICKSHGETFKLGVKLFGTATNDQLDQIRLLINKLLTVGESVLVEFIDMHKTVTEVTYTLGDAFITGGAGMRGSSDVTHPGTSSKQDDQVMNFNLDDFPWDKHNVRSDYTRIDPTMRNLPHYYDYE